MFDAMILAAGLGTRLRPLTDSLPKALVPVAGVPMLERVARRLAEAGAERIVVNVHHHADAVRRFLEELTDVGAEIVISDESDELLETGGALRHAAPLFHGDRPILLHNVDILSTIDLVSLVDAHLKTGALATLATNDRESNRYLLFDDVGLAGYGNATTGEEKTGRACVGTTRRRPFCGLHVLDADLPAMIVEEGAASIIPIYLRLIGEGRVIREEDVTGSLWLDIGRHDDLARAGRLLEEAEAGSSD